MTTITTVLGDSREAKRTYPDGSFDCPYCTYPIIAPVTQCSNPWCEAHPKLSAEALIAIRADKAAHAAEVSRWEAMNRIRIAAAAQRAEAHRQWEREQVAEAKRRGACLRCLFQSGWERVKFIRHRGRCPKQPLTEHNEELFSFTISRETKP